MGYYFDSTIAVSYIRARYYSQTLGRFYSRDKKTSLVQFIEVYTYVKNRPVAFCDPSGLSPLIAGSTRECQRAKCGPEVSEWLVAEINRNKTQYPIHDMHQNWWWPWIPWLANEYLNAFKDKVATGEIWDFKASQTFESASCPWDCPKTVTICGVCLDNDVPGNIHFGYIGAWARIPEKLLYLGADWAQPGGVDDPHDTQAINIGISAATLDMSEHDRDWTVERLCELVIAEKAVLARYNVKEFCSPCPEKYPLTGAPNPPPQNKPIGPK
jgi:RHS repeat-associated protein